MKLKNFNEVDNLTPIQQLMIKSCLARTKQERECRVRDWEEQVVIDEIDFSSSRLIPYFLHGNQLHGITTRHDNRMKIVYKHWWLRTQHISHQLKIVHAALFDAGIKSVVIKGASLKMHYQREELRPMADFDLLVQRVDLERAFQIIKDLGYIPNKLSEMYWTKNANLFLDFHHAISCAHQKNDTQLDLHWRIGSRCSAQFTEGVWNQLEAYEAIPNAQKPNLAYEVFMLIIHAVDSGNKDNLNWILDIAVINEKYDPSFWNKARRLAVAEKKDDLFDYGCFILNQLGVYAPAPDYMKKPRILVSTAPESRQKMTLVHLLVSKIRNMNISVNRLFPYSKGFTKIYYILRRIQFYVLVRRVRMTKS